MKIKKLNLLNLLQPKKKVEKAITAWPAGANIVRVVVPTLVMLHSEGANFIQKGEYFVLRMAYYKSAQTVYLIQKLNLQLSERRLMELTQTKQIEVLGSVSNEELLKLAGIVPSVQDEDGWSYTGDGFLSFPSPAKTPIYRVTEDSEADEGFVRVNGHIVYIRPN